MIAIFFGPCENPWNKITWFSGNLYYHHFLENFGNFHFNYFWFWIWKFYCGTYWQIFLSGNSIETTFLIILQMNLSFIIFVFWIWLKIFPDLKNGLSDLNHATNTWWLSIFFYAEVHRGSKFVQPFLLQFFLCLLWWFLWFW